MSFTVDDVRERRRKIDLYRMDMQFIVALCVYKDTSPRCVGGKSGKKSFVDSVSQNYESRGRCILFFRMICTFRIIRSSIHECLDEVCTVN